MEHQRCGTVDPEHNRSGKREHCEQRPNSSMASHTITPPLHSGWHFSPLPFARHSPSPWAPALGGPQKADRREMCELLHARALLSSIVTLLLHLAVTCVTAFFLASLYDPRSNDIELAPRGRRHVRNSFWDSGAAGGHERFGCGSPIE